MRLEPLCRLVTTEDGAEVFFDLVGRTVWVERAGHEVGRQLLAVTLESGHEAYAWLNQTFCVREGVIDPGTLTARIVVALCLPDV